MRLRDLLEEGDSDRFEQEYDDLETSTPDYKYKINIGRTNIGVGIVLHRPDVTLLDKIIYEVIELLKENKVEDYYTTIHLNSIYVQTGPLKYEVGPFLGLEYHTFNPLEFNGFNLNITLPVPDERLQKWMTMITKKVSNVFNLIKKGNIGGIDYTLTPKFLDIENSLKFLASDEDLSYENKHTIFINLYVKIKFNGDVSMNESEHVKDSLRKTYKDVIGNYGNLLIVN